jgi:glucose/mannose-6-phosphate isomerase
MMRDAILGFAKQFEFQPKVAGARLPERKRFIICGMGGSALAPDLLRAWRPELDIKIHRDYGLPPISKSDTKETLVVLSSYSGNTEEVIDAFYTAKKQKLARAVISVGGKLLELAKKEKVPYIQLPDTGIQPRSALGFTLTAILLVLGDIRGLKEANRLATVLKPEELEKDGKFLSEKFKGFIPVIYTSWRNKAIAYNWKVKFNETSKIPAFYNILPEANHNEMTGFDVEPSTKHLSKNFKFLFIADNEDGRKITRRFSILQKIYEKEGLTAEVVELKGKSRLEKIFHSSLLADWTAYGLARYYGADPDNVPIVEEFKRML